MNTAAELVVGASGGAFASEFLNMVIAEAKMVIGFDDVSKELATTMEELHPIVTQIESMHDIEELKTLMDTIDEASVLVKECLGVQEWKIHLKSYYTRKVDEINKKMVKFCQVQLLLILLRNQGYINLKLEAIYREICSVPKLDDKVPVGLDMSLMKCKGKILDDSVEILPVSALPGESSGVTQLCHDLDLKGSVAGAVGSVAGVLVSETLKLLIAEAIKCKPFKPLSEDLVSTMARLLPLTKQIDSMQNELDHCVEDLKELLDTIERACLLVQKFPSVRFHNKPKYIREIKEINKAMDKFCFIDLQRLQYGNQLTC